MRYPASEKLEIIRMVEGLHLPTKQTLDMLGIPRTGAVSLGSPSIRSLQNAQFIKRQESLIPQEWRHVHAESLLHFSVRVEISHTSSLQIG